MKFRMYQRVVTTEKAAIWASFWLWVLTIGNPDLIDAVNAWIGRH